MYWSDGSFDSVTIHSGSGGECIQVDLGEVCGISRWVIKLAGVSEDIKYNARDFLIEASTGGESWTEIADVYGNTKTVCGRSIDPVSVRYVKLGIRKGTQSDDGGTSIGYITDGCYTVYRNMDFESGAQGFRVNAASAAGGGTIEIRIGSTKGELIGTCEISGTDGWSGYKEFTCPVRLCTGVQDVYLVFRGGDGYLFNIMDLDFCGISGDLTCDRSLDAFDMVLCRRVLADELKLKGLALSNSDMNGDSKTDVADAVKLQRFLLGMPDKTE